MQRHQLIYQLIRNQRLKTYHQILVAALQSGYRVCSVIESLAILPAEKVLVLRHDVDHITAATWQMARIEHALGVHATYYFRWSTFDIDLIKKISALGHECSLHYETFATYALDHGLSPERNQVTAEMIRECQLLLGEEIAKFRKLMDKAGCATPVTTIASHGHIVNRHFDFPKSSAH